MALRAFYGATGTMESGPVQAIEMAEHFINQEKGHITASSCSFRPIRAHNKEIRHPAAAATEACCTASSHRPRTLSPSSRYHLRKRQRPIRVVLRRLCDAGPDVVVGEAEDDVEQVLRILLDDDARSNVLLDHQRHPLQPGNVAQRVEYRGGLCGGDDAHRDPLDRIPQPHLAVVASHILAVVCDVRVLYRCLVRGDDVLLLA